MRVVVLSEVVSIGDGFVKHGSGDEGTADVAGAASS